MSNAIDFRLPELREIEKTIPQIEKHAKIHTLAEITVKDKKETLSLPIYAFIFGNCSAEAPVFAIFGGVHGLERIGTQVVTSYLKTISELLQWDKLLHEILERIRLIFVPLINPGGMFLETRSNPAGVDLMRNAPIEADIDTKAKLYVGHRYSKLLPWYRGREDAPMEIESHTLIEFVKKHVFSKTLSLSVDVHSGFGMLDRLWFPYAKTRMPFPHLSEMYALKSLLDKTYPNHVYCVEPQSKQYLTHGDLWDHLYDTHLSSHSPGIYLPLCLELGSWLWVKKNPIQLFSSLGVFNPLEQHRYQRILRRHLLLMDFLLRATLSHPSWSQCGRREKKKHYEQALNLWYGST